MKRITVLTMLLALSLAPIVARSEREWPGWTTVRVSGLTSHETARIRVQYTTDGGAIKYVEQIVTPSSPARLPLGSKARDLHVIVSVEGSNKVRTFRFATVPSNIDVDFNH